MTGRQIRRIDFEKPEFKKWVQLREEVLRKPLGLTISEEDIAEEVNQIHIGWFVDDSILGGLILKPLDSSVIKMRQVAVHPSHQRKGIGQSLVRYAEEYARNESATIMTLHAREGAVPFYLALGYDTIGEGFIEVHLPHYKMQKSLV